LASINQKQVKIALNSIGKTCSNSIREKNIKIISLGDQKHYSYLQTLKKICCLFRFLTETGNFVIKSHLI
jgi:hypothetical protein